MKGSTGDGEPGGASRGLKAGTLSALLQEIAGGPDAQLGEAWGTELHTGMVVGRFELVRELGRGGFGVVWEARDRELGRSVALKAVWAGARAGLREERLLREAEAAARLSHPNIVTLFDVGRAEQGPYLVLELLRGETLAERLDRGPLPVPEAVRVGLEVAKALAHAHAGGVVHRDLKPGNVFLCQDGRVKVLDFGLAHAFGRRRQDGGTPAYMAPEQMAGAPEDERTDVFALGVMLFEMLSGKLPFPDAKALASSTPAPHLETSEAPALGQLVGRMLAKEPLGRPRDGGSVEEALSSIRDALVRAMPFPAPVRVRRRLPRLAVMGLLAASLGAALAAALALHLREPVGTVPSPAADGRITVAVADFANGTSDRELDALSGLLITSLEQSRRLRVLTRGRMLDLLREMGKGDAPRIDDSLAREVGRRAGAAALLLPSVRRFGEDYVVEMRAIDPARDTYVFAVTERAGDKAGVWELVDRLSARAREALGESAPAVRESRIDVGRAVTTNLEAYAHYFRAEQLAERDLREESIAEYEAALRLDPAFALAQLAIARMAETWPVPEERRLAAMEAAVRAAGRLPEKERLLVEAWKAHLDGRQAEAHATYARAVEAYPQDRQVLYEAGDLFHHEGRYSEAAELFRRALAVDPSWELAAFHLVEDLDELGRPNEGVAVAERVAKANPAAFEVLFLARRLAGDTRGAIQVLESHAALGAPEAIRRLSDAYLLAGRAADAEEQVGRLEVASAEPDWKVEVFQQRAKLAAYRGRIREALAFAERGLAVSGATATKLERARLAAIWIACGLPAAVGRVAPIVESLARRRQDPKFSPELLAYAGDAVRAERLAASLPQRRRATYEAVRTWRAGDGDAALKLLPRGRGVSAIAPFLAGEILLEQGRPAEAAASFRVAQRWTYERYVFLSWILPRSRALLARALADLGDRDAARAELDAFFAALDRPDPDLPLLAEAKALRARLAAVK